MFQRNQQIGGYILIKQIGRGGFGEVWLAEKRSQFVTKKVAIKLPLDEQIKFEAIRQEASLWEQASGHPNILPIIDADIYDGQVIIVSEYAEDGSLFEKLKSEGKFSPQSALELSIGILNGLEFLHSRRIIHRDIKPQNILLQGNTPRLADFGISRAMEGTSNSVTISGTGLYMAPEAFEGKRNVQTDIWSVGVVLYQLLSGNLPFSQANLPELMFAILTREYEPLAADIPEKLRQIVHKALTKVPENRYQSAKEMCEDLEKELVQIKHPSFARTEVLERKQIDNLTIEDKSIVTELPKTVPAATHLVEQTVNQNQSEAKPSNSNTIPPTVVQTEPLSKVLPTAAMNLVDKPKVNRSKSALYAGGIILGLLFLVIGGIGVYLLVSNSPKSDIVITPRDSKLPSVTNTTLVPYRKGNLWGFSDTDGKILIEPKYANAEPLENGLYKVKTAEGWFSGLKDGFIDPTGKEFILNKYDYVISFSEGLALVKKGDRYGFIDKNFQEVIPLKYSEASSFSDGFAVVCMSEECSLINPKGQEVISLKNLTIRYSTFSEGLISFQESEKYGFMDSTGKIIIQPKYSNCYPFSEGLVGVKLNGKWGFIDKSGNTVIPFNYDEVKSFSEGLAWVVMQGKGGFINKSGEVVIPLKFTTSSVSLGGGPFKEGLASIEINGKYGYINRNGDVVIQPKYKFAYPFENGLAEVGTDGGHDYIGITSKNSDMTMITVKEYFED